MYTKELIDGRSSQITYCRVLVSFIMHVKMKIEKKRSQPASVRMVRRVYL